MTYRIFRFGISEFWIQYIGFLDKISNTQCVESMYLAGCGPQNSPYPIASPLRTTVGKRPETSSFAATKPCVVVCRLFQACSLRVTVTQRYMDLRGRITTSLAVFFQATKKKREKQTERCSLRLAMSIEGKLNFDIITTPINENSYRYCTISIVDTTGH